MAPPPPPLRSRQSTGSRTKESRAFVSLFKAFSLSPPCKHLSDLSSGRAFADVLALVDGEAFALKKLPARQAPPSSSSSSSSGDWVSQFNTLKTLHRLLVKYAMEVLPQPQAKFETPDLHKIAKGQDEVEILAFCRIVVAVCVQATPGNVVIIEKIQTLEEDSQQALMIALGPFLPKASSDLPSPSRSFPPSPVLDNHDRNSFAPGERERMLDDKATLETAYNTLIEEHTSLRAQFDDASTELEKARTELKDAGSGNVDSVLRHEVERLKDELRKSEDNLGETEMALEKQNGNLESMTRRIDELNANASEATKLRDQLDEYRHAADRLQKSENANKKLNKKLEESADFRRQIKALEDENANLVDKNASLEEDYRKVSSLKPLADSYKTQLSDLELRERAKSKENTELKFELDRVRSQLHSAEVELANNREEIGLNQERVRELELVSPSRPSRSRTTTNGDSAEPGMLLEDGHEGDDELLGSMGGELDDAMQGTTKTDLKLQVRRLQRELDAARNNKADGSRVLVLENLLDDAKKMKERYEQDYLGAHKANLGLQAQLEAIRSGKALGDGPEATIALRQRLNETVDELDQVKMKLAELEVKHSSISEELTIAKSGLTLCNKDQIEILHSLRESVNEDKATILQEASQLKAKLADLTQKNRMQIDQINGLLMDKVGMQTKDIGHREKLIEREKAFGDLRVSLAGRDLPEDVKARLLDLQDEKFAAEGEVKLLLSKLKTAEDHVQKAKKFIREQDGVIKDQRKKATAALGDNFAEAQQSYEAQITALNQEIARLKSKQREIEKRYRIDYELMASTVHDMGMKINRGHLGGGGKQDLQPSSWLAQQRKQLGGGLRR
ncbi:HOOK-domain-containing protein [Mrakia frigida]|uniref:HOOK-domain-containing protein n=1 Tax=Mrakia frigida TaxID=29902 RepID=UPI003FCC0CD3